MLAETVDRVREAGLALVQLPVWYDVDDHATLRVLEAELLEGRRPEFAVVEGYDAEHTREFLRKRRSAVERETNRFEGIDDDGAGIAAGDVGA